MINKIKSFAKLEEGWNSYDAKKINSITIEKALELANLFQRLEVAPHISVDAEGCILFHFTYFVYIVDEDGQIFFIDEETL